MDPPTETRPERSNVYGFDGQMLAFAAVTTVFLFVVLLVSLRLYARWCLRNSAGFGETRVFVITDNHNPAAAGLDPGVLGSLPVFTYSSKSAAAAEQGLLECAVCLSEFEESEVGRLLPKCNHSFHIECIDMWFHSHSTCPLCRSPVESAAADRVEPSPVGEEMGGPESSSGPSSSSRDEGVDEGSAMPLARRRRAASVKIDVVEGRIESELTEGSPMTRMQSFKRMLSMGGMSPAGSRLTPRYRAACSAEVDLEGGLGEAIRVYTPK